MIVETVCSSSFSPVLPFGDDEVPAFVNCRPLTAAPIHDFFNEWMLLATLHNGQNPVIATMIRDRIGSLHFPSSMAASVLPIRAKFGIAEMEFVTKRIREHGA
jgi:hypothetical protein